MEENTKPTHFALCRHHSTGISAENIIRHPSASKMSEMPRPRKFAQQSSAVHWRVDEELFWSEGKFESHNGVAFTNVTLRIWQSIWVSEAARTIKTLKLKIFPLCKWQLVAKLFSLKKIQPKPGKADWETKPEVLLSKCGLPTVVNGISCGFAKSGLHVDPIQLEIPALCALKLFLAPP